MSAENFEKGKDKFWHFILLAKDAEGHKQIKQLSTRAWNRSWMNGKMRRVPTYYQDLIDIIKVNPGHVIGSTACLGGFLDSKLLQWVMEGRKDEFYQQIIHWVELMKGIFGEDNFYFEMQPAANDEQECANREIIALSDITNTPYVITTDTHYLRKADAPIHKAFLNAQEGDREVDSFYATTYLMSDEELRQFNFTNEQLEIAYKNIEKIRDKCTIYSFKKPLKIPCLDWGEIPKVTKIEQYQWAEKISWLKKFIESDFYGDNVMVNFIVAKLKSNSLLQNQRSYDELNDNLQKTWLSSEKNNAHWSAYFLNLRGILDTCWEAGTLVGPGRGSGVGFYLLYILDLIQINPLWETTQLYSWRFLNPERASVLDIDTDIEGSKRAQVLQALVKRYGRNRVSNVATFGTETSKSALLTAARGLGIDNDIAQYISSLVPADRGKIRTLEQCYYGDDEFAPVALFVQQMKLYPQLWEVAQKIQGLICRTGEHAGGVIFVDEDFENSTALMKAPNGDTLTQLDLHSAEAASLIKIDLLSVECLDKIHSCLDLLIQDGRITPEKTLRETYEKYLGVYNIERKAPKMWDLVNRHEIQSLFQMEKQSGINGIELTKPRSIDDLAVLNSVIRLMAPEKGAEQPLEKYARFRKNINLWYKEMDEYGLTKEEQKILEPILKPSFGLCESQERFMMLVQLPECGGMDLNWADRLRKAIAKKSPKDYDKLTEEYYAAVEEKHLSLALCRYVWQVLVATSRGYGFNLSHTLSYSIVALQEMNLAYRFPIIYWNCACLITDSGGMEEQEEEEVVDIYESEDFEEFEYEDAPDRSSKKKKRKSNNYDKIATAIGKMKSAGIDIAPPDINKSSYTFRPSVEENKIYYGLRGLLNVGEDIIGEIMNNRPYESPKDFINKVKVKKSAMISLIKAGTFDSMLDRKLCMGWYLWQICDKKTNLNLQNMPTLLRYNLIPQDTDEEKIALRVYEFNRYIKTINGGKKDIYTLDTRAIDFLQEIGQDDLINDFTVNGKAWDKVYQKYMDVFREWLKMNMQEVLNKLNTIIFSEAWKHDAEGTLSSWEMKVMCFYYHEHELARLNKNKYGITNFFDLPESPVVDKVFNRGDTTITLFKLSKICGTCIAKNKDKGTVVLLTPDGVVNVKFGREYFSLFDKQLSEKDENGVKKIRERSWFGRGSMIIVQGIRSSDTFIAKKYNSSGGHKLYKITEVLPDGELVLQTERYQGE